jgi:hypothetical protein
MGERRFAEWKLAEQPGQRVILSNEMLLQEFVKSTARLQNDGDILLIGLTLNRIWSRQYKLAALLQTAKAVGYQHYEQRFGDEDSLIKECVNFGYRHHSIRGRPIHDFVVETYGSMLHIFVKEGGGKLSST